jgi:serine/threonine-protein kinase
MASGAPQSSERSASVGKYRLLASLGRGGMAEVYLAVVSGPAGFNKLQVVKLLRSHLAAEPEFVTMFLDEARLAARLNHPNVVQTNEVGEANGSYFIAMEYLEGQAFARIIRHAPREVLLRVVSDTLAGLHYAHELADYDGSPLGVVHRDASPHNIFVGYDGQVRLVDFGIAKAATSSTDTMVGMIKGKVSYMSPEQASGTRVDRRSDVFSMGIVLWEAIAGRRLWEGLNDVQIIHALALGNIPPIAPVCPDLDPALEAVVMRALAVSRDDRFATAQDLREALLGYLDGAGKRVSQEAVGQVVSSMFAEKRATLRGLVEQQLRDLRRGGEGLRIVDVETASISGATSPDRIAGTPVTDSAPRPSLAPISGRQSGPGGGLVASQWPRRDSASKGDGARTGWPIGLASGLAALMCLAIVAGFWLRSGRAMIPTNTTAPEPSAPAAATPPSALSSRVEVRFSASPTEAKLVLDDRPLPGNPYTALVEPDGKPHRLRVEAPGYVTESRDVFFEAQTQLSVRLVAEAASTVAASSAPPPAVAPPSGPGRAKTWASPPTIARPPGKRSIDKANPWSD